MRSTVITTVVIIEKSSFGWKWHIWCACLSQMSSTVNTAVVIIGKSSFIQKECIWMCMFATDEEVLKGHKDYNQVVLDVIRSSKRFPPGQSVICVFIPPETKYWGQERSVISGIAVSICLSVICFFLFMLCSLELGWLGIKHQLTYLLTLWNYEMITTSLSQPVVCDKSSNEIFMADIRCTIF